MYEERKEGSRKVPEAPESTKAMTEMGKRLGKRMWMVRDRWQGVGKGRGGAEEGRHPARPLLAGAGVSREGVSWGLGWGERRELVAGGLRRGWELVPGSWVLGMGLGDQLEALGDGEGAARLKPVGTGLGDMASPTTVSA